MQEKVWEESGTPPRRGTPIHPHTPLKPPCGTPKHNIRKHRLYYIRYTTSVKSYSEVELVYITYGTSAHTIEAAVWNSHTWGGTPKHNIRTHHLYEAIIHVRRTYYISVFNFIRLRPFFGNFTFLGAQKGHKTSTQLIFLRHLGRFNYLFRT